MLIVTQRGELVNLGSVERVFLNPEAFECDGCRVIASGASGSMMTLGWYESTARADDVLTEILEEYASGEKRKYEMPRV